jgi:hypothetical protein
MAVPISYYPKYNHASTDPEYSLYRIRNYFGYVPLQFVVK